MSEPFIAEIRMMPYTFAPVNWAWCAGQLLPLSQYMALFSIIGTTYGGDGRNTVGLPNLMGRAPMGAGQSPGYSNYSPGATVGQESVSLAVSQVPSHTHTVEADSAQASESSPTNGLPAGAVKQGRGGVTAELKAYNSSADTLANPASVSSAGDGMPHENRQPYLGVNFCIALEGLYPSRS